MTQKDDISMKAYEDADPMVLARRAVESEHFRWMAGMLIMDNGAGVRFCWEDNDYLHGCAEEGKSWMRLSKKKERLPDVRDPATMGCLLALAREAWKTPVLQVSPSLPDGKVWSCYVNDDEDHLYRMPTEVAAIIAALDRAMS